jgi:hypothetical protein
MALRLRNHLLFLVAAGLLMLLLATDACSSAKTYTLYYIDTTHNVSRALVDSTGRPVGSPKLLTTGGKYDVFSVSPDEKYVVGMRNIEPMSNLDGKWIEYLETVAGHRVTPLAGGRAIFVDGIPGIRWAVEQGRLVCDVPGNAWYTSSIFTTGGRKLPYESENDFIDALSADRRLAFVRETVCCGNDYPGDFGVIDLLSGERTTLMKADSQESPVWFGKAHRFAVIDGGGRLWGGEVVLTSGKPKITRWPITSYGGCKDLRYIPGRGVYFFQRSGDGRTTAYITSDLRTLRKTAGLPLPKLANARQAFIDRELADREDAWTSTASLTADHEFLAVPVETSDGGMPEIRVFTRDGRSVAIARGKYPKWRDAWER